MRDLGSMATVFAASIAAAATSVAEPTAPTFPLSLLLWCFVGSFAGMGVAGPSRLREAMAELQGKTALALELAVFGVGGVLSLVGTSLIGFGVIGAMHVLGKQGALGLGWAGQTPPADLFPFGILISGVLQFRAQMLMTKFAELAASWMTMLKRKGGE